MRPSKIGSLIARVLIAYGVMGGLSSTCSLAKSAQNAVLQTNETLKETAQPDTIASIQAADSVKPQNLDSSIDIEIDQRFNELRGELLDDRSNTIEWWLAFIGLVLTFFAIVVPIVGYLGYGRFRKIEEEALEAVIKAQKSEQEAKRLVEEIKKIRNRSNEYYQGMTAEKAVADPTAEQKAESVRKDPQASLKDKLIASAIAFQKEGKTDQAITKWESIASATEEIDNDLATRAWFSVGYLLLEKANLDGNRDDLKKALAAYSRSIELTPSIAEAHNNRGIIKAKLGLYQDAIIDFDESIRLNPSDAEAHSNRGNAKTNLRQYEDAIADHNRAIELNPILAGAYTNRGNAKFGMGRVAEARADFKKALEIAKKIGDVEAISMAKNRLRDLAENKNT